jgi:NAD(P)-dependent dehydrogenase (short-subunit alcohol dehydrogenase family)
MSPPHILVTGGSRGIGAAICRLAGARGWRVTVNFRADSAAAQDVVAAVAAAGGAATAVGGDVAAEADVAARVDAAEAAVGPVTGGVANAGILAPAARLADMDAARLRRVVDVNLLGALFTAREAARRMSASRGGAGGALVFVSSLTARLGAPGEFVDYAATKGALDTLTVGLARELGPEGIRVNAVRPGIIDTEIHVSSGEPGRVARIGATAPLGRPGTAEEVAEAVIWLLSDSSAYASGALLDVTGGR